MMPRAVIKGRDPEVQEKYNAMTSRLGELRAELGSVNGEINQITGSLGEQVADGDDWQKSIARVGKLRLESEGLELGIKYIDGQIELLLRSHYWLTR